MPLHTTPFYRIFFESWYSFSASSSRTYISSSITKRDVSEYACVSKRSVLCVAKEDSSFIVWWSTSPLFQKKGQKACCQEPLLAEVA